MIDTVGTRTVAGKYYRCPECGKRSAYLKLGAGEDHWRCRTPGCEWFAYNDGTMADDVTERRRLAQANGGGIFDASFVRGYYDDRLDY